jgi:hypothetical protein
MRNYLKWMLLAPAVMIAACDRSAGVPAESSGAISDELRRDLQLAATSGIELAATDFQPRRFVSGIEQPPGPGPERARSPKPQPRPKAKQAPEPDVVTVATAEIEPEIVDIAAAPTEAPAPVSTVPVPVPFPTQPANGGDARDGGRGSGGVLGGIIGVVIRGGAVGEDRCEIHRGGRRRGGLPPGGIAINTRFPIGNTTFPQGGPSFPRRR